MSEEAKPVCPHCERLAQWTDDAQERLAQSVKEVNALRAAHEALLRRTQSLETALDQERAKVRQLRDVIEASGEWLPNSRGKLIFQFGGGWIANDETLALLSGRGEGEGNG